MKKHRSGFLKCFAAAAALSAGCSTNPYAYESNWAIRQDAVLDFSCPVDVFYVQGALFERSADRPALYAYAKSETVDKFKEHARVFSPYISYEEDVAAAVETYLARFHSGKNPFVLIGEGEGGRFLKAYEDDHAEDLRKAGMVASFYSESSGRGFVTEQTIRAISAEVAKERYRRTWGREVPADFLSGSTNLWKEAEKRK